MSKAPHNSNYTRPAPSIGSRTSKVRFFPDTGGKWTPESQNVIRIRLHGSKFLDPEKSYLQFDVKNEALVGDSRVHDPRLCLDYGAPVFQRMIIRSGGVELCRCNEYGKYIAQRLFGQLNTSEIRSYASAQGGQNDALTGVTTVSSRPERVIYKCPTFDRAHLALGVDPDNPVYGGIGPQASRTCTIPLWGCALFESGKLIPLPLLGRQWIEIELELARPGMIGVTQTTGTTSSGGNADPADFTVPKYSVDNVALVAQCVTLDQEYVNTMRMALHESGSLAMCGLSYAHHQASLPTAEEHNIRIPIQKNNIRSILMITNDIGAEANEQAYATSPALKNISEWQYKCASEVFPAIAHEWSTAHVAIEGQALWNGGYTSPAITKNCYTRKALTATFSPAVAVGTEAGSVSARSNVYIAANPYAHVFTDYEGEYELARAGLNSESHGVALDALFKTSKAAQLVTWFVQYEQKLFLLPDGRMEERS